MQARNRLFRYLATSSLILTCGCGGPDDPTPAGGSTSANVGGSEPTCRQDSATSSGGGGSQAIASVIHREVAADAINLSLDDDGTARFALYGCDTCGGWTAKWLRDGDDIFVLPAANAATFPWLDEYELADAATEVRLSRSPDGRIMAHVEASTKAYDHPWLDGRTCAKCCGGLGPTGQFACEAPLPADPCAQGVWWSCAQNCAV